MKTLFITGTGTGIGKTLASALLCRELISQGYKVGYMKPVQTGCLEKEGQLLSPDAEFVKIICGDKLQICCPYSFRLPASPHLASAQEGVKIQSSEIADSFANFKESAAFDFIIAEGAGGISVPLNDELDMADLCKLLDAQMILVTTTSLGTLNHTKLTVEYAGQRDLECSVIISGCTENPGIIEEDNVNYISKMVDDRVLFKIPFIIGVNTESSSPVNLPSIKLNSRLFK